MWEEDRWAPAKRRLTPPNAGRDSVQSLERGKPGTTVLEPLKKTEDRFCSRLALRCWNPCVCDSLPTPQCMFPEDSGRLSLEDTHHQLHLRIWSRLPHHPPACYLTKSLCEEVSLNTTWVLFVVRLTSIS